ncbi:MAG: 4a-hydroxytetrahydrobiopterin dehydratase [Pararhodobacter sp.]|nr:4a-hydroxytetrahydrobiopterin dehydratase [Pararhodobacter sp.]
MRPQKLNTDERDRALPGLKARGWTHDAERDAITKSYRFADFARAFGWMTKVALAAEKMDHHPEWRNVYNRVEVVLTTHDARGLTTLDLELADRMDVLAAG